jgi:hypothetical protein
METISEKLYRIAVNGEEIGAYTMSDLQAFWSSGQLDQRAQYFHEGIKQWKPVAMILAARTSQQRFSAQRIASGSRSDLPRVTYVMLALLLGGLGVHNFAAGHTARAFFQLALTVAGFIGIWPAFLVVFFWVLAEAFMETNDGKGRRFS